MLSPGRRFLMVLSFEAFFLSPAPFLGGILTRRPISEYLVMTSNFKFQDQDIEMNSQGRGDTKSSIWIRSNGIIYIG
jgi:hypothetical protein